MSMRLRAHHVGDGDDRKIEAIGLAGLRIDRRRAGRAHAAAQTFEQMTKKRSVSNGLPGPTIVSHQPALARHGVALATCWSPVSAWQINMRVRLVGVEERHRSDRRWSAARAARPNPSARRSRARAGEPGCWGSAPDWTPPARSILPRPHAALRGSETRLVLFAERNVCYIGMHRRASGKRIARALWARINKALTLQRRFFRARDGFGARISSYECPTKSPAIGEGWVWPASPARRLGASFRRIHQEPLRFGGGARRRLSSSSSWTAIGLHALAPSGARGNPRRA